MGHQEESTETDADKIRSASAEETQCKFLYTDTRTDICSDFDSESISKREGGSRSFC